MKELLNHIINKIDKIDDKLDSVDKTLVKQEENLQEHMRRSDLLEKQHNHLEKEIHLELEPVKSHINQVKGISKFLAITIPIVVAIVIYSLS